MRTFTSINKNTFIPYRTVCTLSAGEDRHQHLYLFNEPMNGASIQIAVCIVTWFSSSSSRNSFNWLDKQLSDLLTLAFIMVSNFWNYVDDLQFACCTTKVSPEDLHVQALVIPNCSHISYLKYLWYLVHSTHTYWSIYI